jgi:hypothetical protein
MASISAAVGVVAEELAEECTSAIGNTGDGARLCARLLWWPARMMLWFAWLQSSHEPAGGILLGGHRGHLLVQPLVLVVQAPHLGRQSSHRSRQHRQGRVSHHRHVWRYSPPLGGPPSSCVAQHSPALVPWHRLSAASWLDETQGAAISCHLLHLRLNRSIC